MEEDEGHLAKRKPEGGSRGRRRERWQAAIHRYQTGRGWVRGPCVEAQDALRWRGNGDDQSEYSIGKSSFWGVFVGSWLTFKLSTDSRHLGTLGGAALRRAMAGDWGTTINQQ
jgi:hypothetical protein